jgi:hypothetical protein
LAFFYAYKKEFVNYEEEMFREEVW